MYTSDREQPYRAGRSDPLDAVIAMERAGLLTKQAAGIIARFSALSDTVVSCGWHSATRAGWVTYCGVTYTPAGFSAMIAQDSGPDEEAPDGETPDEEAPDGEPDSEWWEGEFIIEPTLPTLPLMPTLPPSLPMLQVDAPRRSDRSSISDGPHGRLFAALACLGALALFAAALVAVAWMTGVLLLNVLSQLIALLVRGFLALIGG